MTTIPKVWTLASLPAPALDLIRTVRWLGNRDEFRAGVMQQASLTGESAGLFSMMGGADEPAAPAAVVESGPAPWSTTSYVSLGEDYAPYRPVHDFSVIKFRVEKTRAEQVKRTKEKAEVFTPTWLVNAQNNLVDAVMCATGFNTEDTETRTWTPTSELVTFTPESGEDWVSYILQRRLEMCCGEGPYLFTPYDAVSGKYLPVRDTEGRFQRVGLFDRKLRVAAEHCDTPEEWDIAARAALKATYGYEWQGDNLVLARLNMLNTFFDYYRDFCETKGFPWPPRADLNALACEILEIASWQIWQMDGLRSVLPGTCAPDCRACKKRLYIGHDGLVPVFRMQDTVVTFEQFMDGQRAGKFAQSLNPAKAKLVKR